MQNELFEKCNLETISSEYELLSPDITWLSANAFIEKQKYLIIDYAPLKKNLSIFLDQVDGNYSLYFEDLTTGAWAGINEREKFIPLSLLKVPTLIATLKEVELGHVLFNTTVVLNIEDIDARSGDLWKKGPGYNLTVKDLMEEMIKHSDNTALLTLNRRVITDETFFESRLAMGLPAPTLDEPLLTPKEYSNMLRGLYLSSYLRRPFSELALTLMLETDFNSQIPAGLPPDIRVAHKVGFYDFAGSYHDCGIIYAPNNPYILCIMSTNTTSKEADKVMSEVSRIVYDFISSRNVSNTN
ncbi:MAG: serine hydrolase [Candidatus Woesearchaeota archaeon]